MKKLNRNIWVRGITIMVSWVLFLIVILFTSSCSNECDYNNEYDIASGYIPYSQNGGHFIYDNVLKMSIETFNLISSFRPAIRDVAVYMLTHKDELTLDRFTLKCGEFEFWICNGKTCFKLYRPVEIDLTLEEKIYFWNIYEEYIDNDLRLYYWENEVLIIEE